MSDMVGRVAKAMLGSEFEWGAISQTSRQDYLEAACAAIASMRDRLIQLGTSSGSSAYEPAIDVLTEALNDADR